MAQRAFSEVNLSLRLASISARAEEWMLREAFPFWAMRAPDLTGGFFERLDLQGQGIPNEPSRVRVQARMGFSFALAAQLGWDRDRSRVLTNHAVNVLIKNCRRPDGLYGKLTRTGVGLVDDTAEAYDTAFALLAFATAYKAFGLENALEAGQNVSKAIDTFLLRSSLEGGFKERLPAPDARAQNPHMHLTEASLAWYDATGDRRALERAQEITQFVKNTFFRAGSGQFVEFAGVAEADNRLEVGHWFEWVWILGRLRELSGAAPDMFAEALHNGAMKLIDGVGYLPLAQDLDGSVVTPKQRTWVVAEKLKGHIAQWRCEPSDHLAWLAVDTAEMLFADHLNSVVAGAWIDVIAPDRTPLVKDITPATGYHVFLALQELTKFADQFVADGK